MEPNHSQLLMSLIYSFQMQCMMQLGKIKNPMSDTVERDLDAAKITIDMLDMLKEKTKNNVDDQEKKFLEQVTAELKLNYVDEKAKDEKGTESLPKNEGQDEETSTETSEENK